jgi:site-specific recombinase XerD
MGSWVRRFLLEHMVAERNLSLNTQASYRDTLVLLLPFLSNLTKTAADRLLVEDLSGDAVKLFLNHLEKNRHCSGATRNQRLGAIHSFAKFVGTHSPEHLAWCTEIRAVPFKRTARPSICYLDKPEMHALLRAPDGSTPQGRRDYALLLFLYNTGARADEVARLTIADLNMERSPAARLIGKGNKTRHCPLWSHTVKTIRPLVADRPAHEHVFLNRLGQPLTRFGIYNLVQRAALLAGHQLPSLKSKHISPHVVRHTSAVHLLRAGVDINTIRAWLGHVSLDTTHVYAEVDLEMKAKALARCDIEKGKVVGKWRKDPSVMEFLRAL